MPRDWDTYFAENRASWDARASVHAASTFYDVASFKAGRSSLKPIELALVGDVRGKRLLHLQCHFGLDTLSWARLGADVVGVDFSSEAIRLARDLAAEVGLEARFVECNVYDTRAHVKDVFEVVFTSYGVIGWLPDLRPWAKIVRESLAPGGRFVMVEFHPYVWISQFGPDLRVRYSYFNRGVITETSTGTYADPSASLTCRDHGWNHSLAEIIGALIDAGLSVDRFEEYDSCPFDLFPNCERGEDGNYRFREAPGMVPMLLALEASVR